MKPRTRRAALPLCWAITIALAAAGGISRAESLGLRPAADRVGRYETITFLIEVEPTFDRPFDPDVVDLRLVVTAPSGAELRIPAFFMRDFETDASSAGSAARQWLYPRGKGEWRARFAPLETGEHHAVARLRTRERRIESESVRFLAMPSARPGFVRVSSRDPRFFERGDGGPFFAIGQNLAFIGHDQYVSFSRAEDIFAELSRNGANYVRIWTCCKDWALAIEAEKSAWGRSWGPPAPIVARPDDSPGAAAGRCVRMDSDQRTTLAIAPSRAVALRPSTRYAVTGELRTDGAVRVVFEVAGHLRETVTEAAPAGRWRPFRREFVTAERERWLPRSSFQLEGRGTAWVDGLSLSEAAGGPELIEQADVDREMPGTYDQLDCFLLDRLVDSAERHGIALQLCLITRDLYMDALRDPESEAYEQATRHAKNLLRYAVARWGASTSVATWEYFNEMDPRLPTGPFYAELAGHLDAIDPYRHLRATSTWHPSPRDWSLAALDVADEHFYLRSTAAAGYSDEVGAVLGRARFLREHAPTRPALLSEFGLATERWGLDPRMQRDQELAHVHNALWASALSGLSGTAMFWWWEELDRKDAYRLYRPLASFVAGIPYVSRESGDAARLRSIDAAASIERVLVAGLGARDRAYLWIFDRDAAWVARGLEGVVPAPVRDLSVELAHLGDGDYRIEWWSTREGRVLAERTGTSSDGSLRLVVPTFTGDIACKVLPR